MTGKRWKKYQDVNRYVLEILKDGKALSTWGIREKLRTKYNLFLHHTTIKKYLEDMRKLGHIQKLELNNDKNEVGIWIRK